MKKIYAWEPWFFMCFGLFHLQRIWGLIDRTSYADFWLGILESKGTFYFVLMGILAFLCVCGIVTFCKNKKNNYYSFHFSVPFQRPLNAVKICIPRRYIRMMP